MTIWLSIVPNSIHNYFLSVAHFYVSISSFGFRCSILNSAFVSVGTLAGYLVENPSFALGILTNDLQKPIPLIAWVYINVYKC